MKLVDFGSAIITDREKIGAFSFTPGYCPPDYLIATESDSSERKPMEPSFDMWGLGVIVYSELLGLERDTGCRTCKNLV